MKFNIAFWNMLADGLSDGEFMCLSPRDLAWKKRGPLVIGVINRLFAEGYDVVSVVENDHFLNILEGLQVGGRTIHGILQRVRNPEKNTNSALTQHIARSYPMSAADKTADNTARVMKPNPETKFTTDIGNDSDRAAFLQQLNGDKPSAPAQVPDFEESGAYVSDYGNSVYFNPARVSMGSIPEWLTEFNPDNKTRSYKCFVGSGDVGFVQGFVIDGCEFTVLTAHLPSGEGLDEEAERVAKLAPLLQRMKDLPNPVVVMDSNSSVHYRKGILRNLTHVFQENGFKNIILDDGNECFKMRDAGGAQPPKFAEFVLDAIDAVLVSERSEATVRPMKMVEFYPTKYRAIMYEMRTNTRYRQRLSNWVLNCDNVYDDNGKFVSGEAEIRPSGPSACVPIQNKTKTKTLKMMSSNKPSRWGEDVTKNVYTGIAEYIGLPNTTDDLFSDMFKHLYPNDTMPSDHPPIGASITLTKKSTIARIYGAIKYYLGY